MAGFKQLPPSENLGKYLKTIEFRVQGLEGKRREIQTEVYRGSIASLEGTVGQVGPTEAYPKLDEYGSLPQNVAAVYLPIPHTIAIGRESVYSIALHVAVRDFPSIPFEIRKSAGVVAERNKADLGSTLVHELVHSMRRNAALVSISQSSNGRSNLRCAEEAVACFAEAVIANKSIDQIKLSIHGAVSGLEDGVAYTFGHLLGYLAAFRWASKNAKELVQELIGEENPHRILQRVLPFAIEAMETIAGMPQDVLLGGEYVKNKAPALLRKFIGSINSGVSA